MIKVLLLALLAALASGCATNSAIRAPDASSGTSSARVGLGGRLKLTPPAAQEVVNCAVSTACTSTGPSNTGTGDQLWLSFGKLNEDNQKLFDVFGSGSNFATQGTALYSDLLSLWTGTKDGSHCPAGDGTMAACGGGSGGVSSFSGDGSLLSNSASTGAVAATLANTGMGYGIFGNIGAASGAPAYHALSSYPTAAFPTLNQSTTGQSGTALALAGTPTLCSTGNAPTGILANGNATGCAAVGGGGSMVYPGAGIPNSTGTAWGTSYTASGTGTVICLTVSCVMTTPNIGAATATSINGDVFTAGSYTLTGSAGKTFTFTNSITISGTDATTMTLPGTSQSLAGLGAAQTWTGAQTFTNSDIKLLGSSTGATTLTSANASVTNYTATLPAATDTVVELTQAQTLTNKSIAASEVNSGTLPTAQLPALTGDVTASAGTGATSVVKVNGGALPVSAASLATNSSGQIITGSAGGGTVTDGSGTTTANQLMVSSTTSHAYTVATPSACFAVTSSTVALNAAINAQTGTTYTVLSTDACKLVTLSNASAVAVTLPQATGSFAAGFSFDVQNLGAGTVTITPTTSTINGVSTLVLKQNEGCSITSDGTNYQVSACAAVTPAVNLAGTGHGGVTGTLPAGNLPAALSSSTSVNGTSIPSSVTLTQTIASGTATLGTSAITSAACATAVTVSATGVATTDTITTGFNGDPTAVTGYSPVTTGMLTIVAYPTANNVNFKVCNLTASSVTPGAVTLNWRVVR